MTAIEFLKQPYKAEKRIKLNIEKLNAVRSSLMGRSVSYEGSGGTGSKENSIEKAIAKVLSCEEQINSEIDRLVDVKLEVEKAIDALVKDERLAEILTRRYVCFQRWEEIAEAMHYEKRYLFKIHKQALNVFAYHFEKRH